MVRFALWLVLAGLTICGASAPASAERCPQAMAEAIPTRALEAPTGSEFADRVRAAFGTAREADIEAQLLAGNMPTFLRRLAPVELRTTMPDGRRAGVTICVTSDYLAVGSDRDFLHVPMALPTAIQVARGLGFMLPTRSMVDAIYRQAAVRFRPEPLPASDAMRSTAYYVEHDRRVAAQRAALGAELGALMAGHKKDLVITNRLRAEPDRVAIYGWHRAEGQPIQPLSTVHGARYADYSHGVRLVSLVAFVEGQPRSLLELLEVPPIAAVLSDEGPVTQAGALIGRLAEASGPPIAVKARDLTRDVAAAPRE